ncbi:hypothetical protein D3C71_2159640 [compost metagenome]
MAIAPKIAQLLAIAGTPAAATPTPTTEEATPTALVNQPPPLRSINEDKSSSSNVL